MRSLIGIFILIFSLKSWCLADDIKDFQIEGMNIGDSLLDYYDKKEIQTAYDNATYYKDKIFTVIFVKKEKKKYNRIQVTLKPDDKKHIIYALEGIIDFDRKIDKCNQQKKVIIQDLSQIISSSKRVDDDRAFAADSTGESFTYATWFFLNSGGHFSISCTKMGDEVRKKNGWTDELSVSITSEELENFLRGNPY